MDTTDTKKLAEIESTVASLRKRLVREVTITTVVGVIGLVAVCAYSIYGYTEINQLLEPQMLVTYAASMAEDKLPELRTNLEEEVKKNAPVWAEEMSRQAIASIPDVRAQLEDHVLGQVDAMFEETVSLTKPEMQKFMTEHKPEIARAIDDLKKEGHVLSDESIVGIENAINETLHTDMKAHAQEALRTLQEMVAKGGQLKEGKDLNEFDARLREIIMILRRFHLREKANGIQVISQN
jgi:hypothetical protein